MGLAPLSRTAAAWGNASRLLLDPLLAAIFPARCCGCGAGLERPLAGPLCAGCWGLLPRHRSPLCGCGLPLPSALAAPCGRCRRGLAPVARGFSLGPYEGALRTLIHELKYRSRRRVAERLAELICADPSARATLAAGTLLVPVPLHPRRARLRGFNQAELLAAGISRRSGIELAARALARRRDTPAQAGLSAAARRRNVAGAFGVREPASVAGRTLVLVDDVLTTGATTRACAQALLQAGAHAVHVLTIARVR